ncbi:organic cation transporter protein-like [Littorina saxatilis]
MKFDDVLKQIGEFGPYQKRVFFLTALPSVLSAFEAISVVFTFNIPNHRCAIPGYPNDHFHVTNTSYASILNQSVPRQLDGTFSKCRLYSDVSNDVIVSNVQDAKWSNRTDDGFNETSYSASRNTDDCTKWVYDHSVFETTIASDFDVVCDRSVLRASSNLIAELGCLFGTFVCGFVADRFGRKIPFYIGGLALVAGGFGIAFTDNFIALNVCRFVLGMARLALWVNGMVIGMEIVGPSKRVFVGIFMELSWCLGMLLLLIFTYFIRNWRYLEIALSVPSIFLLAYWWLIPESPRWLASKGREKEALQVLEKIAASNKTKLPEVDDVTSLLDADKCLSFKFIFTSRELIVRMLIIFSNMFVLCVIYYALILNITNLAGDIYINYLLSVIVETVGFGVPYFLLDRMGRKPVYCIAIMVAGFCCVISLVPDILGAPDWVVVTLSMIGRFCVCICYSVIYMFGAELFPTVIRGSAMGMGVTFSRIGGLLSPYLADVGILIGGRLENSLPLVVMGSPALVVGLFALWLPETMGTKLPETLDDVNNLHSKRGCFCCQKNKPDVRETIVNRNKDALASSPC